MKLKHAFILICVINLIASCSNNKPLLVDEARVLTVKEKRNLKSDLKNIKGDNKYRLHIYTVTGGDTLKNYYHRESFLNQIKHQYQPNTVLIYVAVKDRKIHIRTGRNIQDYLTNSLCLYTIHQITPHFKKVNYYTGLKTGVSIIDSIVSQSGL